MIRSAGTGSSNPLVLPEKKSAALASVYVFELLQFFAQRIE